MFVRVKTRERWTKEKSEHLEGSGEQVGGRGWTKLRGTQIIMRIWKAAFLPSWTFFHPLFCSTPAKSTRSRSSLLSSQILASLFRSSLSWTFFSPCTPAYTLPPLFTSPRTHFLLTALFPFYLYLLSPFLYLSFQFSLRQIDDPTAEPLHASLSDNRPSPLFPLLQTFEPHYCRQCLWILLESFNLQFTNVKGREARKKLSLKLCIWTCAICLSVSYVLIVFAFTHFLFSCPIFIINSNKEATSPLRYRYI